MFQSVEAQRESDRAARAARIAQAREVAAAALDNYEGDPEGSILAAVEAVEITRRQDGIVLPEALNALRTALGLPSEDFEGGVFGVEKAPPGELTANALVLSDESLLELARDRVERPMSEEECRFYLHLTACPLATVPDVVGSTEEAARSVLGAAGFRVVVAFTRPTSNPEQDGTVLVQDPARGGKHRRRGEGRARPCSLLEALAREVPQLAEAIVHVKRVRLWSGARPPGRTPARTSSTGDGALVARASRSASRPC